MSATGLSARERVEARKKVVRAAMLGYRHAPAIHYTQSAARWQGIDRHLRSYKGRFPTQADCSSFATWVLWDALLKHINDGLGDIVNGQRWKAGYTGTILQHGQSISRPSLAGDLIVYGRRGSTGAHVAISVGGRKAVSHGSEGGPYLVDYQYRGDVQDVRRVIR